MTELAACGLIRATPAKTSACHKSATVHGVPLQGSFKLTIGGYVPATRMTYYIRGLGLTASCHWEFGFGNVEDCGCIRRRFRLVEFAMRNGQSVGLVDAVWSHAMVGGIRPLL